MWLLTCDRLGVEVDVEPGPSSIGVTIETISSGRTAGPVVGENSSYEFIEGDVVFHGGQWDESRDRFVVSPRFLEGRRLACKIKGERIFLLGCACPLDELIDDEEALDGSLRYQEDRKSLTNSKSSLEHTLPRSVAFAERYVVVLRDQH